MDCEQLQLWILVTFVFSLFLIETKKTSQSKKLFLS